MRWLSALAVLAFSATSVVAQPTRAETPGELLALAKEFREWRRADAGAVPDYAARVQEQKKRIGEFKRRLEALQDDRWPVSTKVDYLVVRSEMDRLDFELNVIRQVSRNPDFYLNEAVRRVTRHIGGRYQMGPNVTVPYDAKRAAALVAALNDTAAVVEQAPKNLTEAVGEMADMTLERLVDIRKNYGEFAKVVAPHLPEPQRTQLGPAADAAAGALEKYGDWIRANRQNMRAPLPIGRAAFDWYVQNVLFFPYSSEELLTQAVLERDRGWAFLQFERQKNRRLPPPRRAKSNAEYSEWKDATDVLARMWAEEYELFTRPEGLGSMRHEDGGLYIEPFGPMSFPTTAKPAGTKTEFLFPPDHFFNHNYWNTGHRMDPGVNHAHSDYPGHTFEGWVSQRTTSDIRRGHNTRGDSWCYYMEEAQLQLDFPFVNGPRTREWMYSLHIMRAERVYVAVKFADGTMKPADVERHFMQTVPGMEPHVAKQHEVWRKFTDPAQVLTYQVGRTEVYKLLRDRMMQLGDRFNLREFHDQLLATGQIPITLARWELTGLDDQVRHLWKSQPLSAITASRAD